MWVWKINISTLNNINSTIFILITLLLLIKFKYYSMLRQEMQFFLLLHAYSFNNKRKRKKYLFYQENRKILSRKSKITCKAELKDSWIIYESINWKRDLNHAISAHIILKFKNTDKLFSLIPQFYGLQKKKKKLHAILLAYLAMKSYTCIDCIKNKIILTLYSCK